MRVSMMLLAVAMLAVVTGCATCARCNSKTETPVPGEPAGEVLTPQPEDIKLPKVWDFSAEWCPPCSIQEPIILEVQQEYEGKVDVRIVDVDKDRAMAEKFNIRLIPTQVFMDVAGNELLRHTSVLVKDSIIYHMKEFGFIESE